MKCDCISLPKNPSFVSSWELSFVMLCAVPVLIYITINYTYKVNELREEIDVNIDDGFEQVSECFRYYNVKSSKKLQKDMKVIR